MAITVRTTINPANMANNWAAKVAQSGTTWLNGVKSPRRLPNADPTKNAADWIANVTAAQPQFIAGISAADYLPKLEAGATAKQSSYSGAGAAHKAQAQQAFTKVAAAIESILPTLPARGPAGTNSARSTAFQTAMHAKKGTLGKTP